VSMNIVTNSPQADIADMFLDAVNNLSPTMTLGMDAQALDATFQAILENSRNQLETAAAQATQATSQAAGGLVPSRPAASNAATPPPEPIKMGGSQNRPRCTPWEEMQRQLESLGLPTDSLTMPKESMDDLKKVLKESGFDDDQIEDIFAQLSEGELTVGRVIAVVNSFEPSMKKFKLTVSEETIPLLGRFLEEIGLDAAEVQAILNELKPGDTFSASKLQQLITKNTDFNLKGDVFANVDMENLRDMLSSLGVEEEDMDRLWNTLTATKGKMSLEGFMGFLRSVDRPAALTKEQAQSIQDVVKELKLSSTLKKKPVFNKILSLLQSMGDKEIDQKFLSSSPAIQALRGGVTTAENITGGMGSFGQESDTGQSGANYNGQNSLTGSETRMANSAATAKASGTFQSRLSQAVALQVAEKMIFQARNNQNRLTLQLEPKDLGKLNIQMAVRQNQVTATIIAENPMAKEALEEQIGQLRNSLSQQGLNLERFDVSLSSDDRNAWTGQNEGRANRFAGQRQGKNSSDDANIEIDAQQTATTAQRGLVDRMI
jgi:hypothetical protein